MAIRLIAVPYDHGHYRIDMGAGPMQILEAGAESRLRDLGRDVSLAVVEATRLPSHEIGAAFHLNGLLADLVREAIADRCTPVVLAGNCNACLGVLGGLAERDIGIVWFDAHGDFHTPETSRSGYFDGFALNVAVGKSWKLLAEAVTGFQPVPEEHVVLAATRDLDAEEEEEIRHSSLIVCDYDQIRGGGLTILEMALDTLAERVDRVYLHVDLDVLDPTVARANEFAPRGGLDAEQLDRAIGAVGARMRLAGATLSSFNPSVDPSGEALHAALLVLDGIARLVPNGSEGP